MVAESLVHLLGTRAAAAEACGLFALLLPAISAISTPNSMSQLFTQVLRLTKTVQTDATGSLQSLLAAQLSQPC